MRANRGIGWAMVALVCLGVAGCGHDVKGHTYAAADDSITIVFQSGGTASVTMGPITSTCAYTQSGKQINLTCGGQTEVLTMASDGSLDGPPEVIGHLTKVK